MPVLTITIPDEWLSRLQELASAQDQTLEQCHEWVLENYLASEDPELDDLEESLRDLDEGRVIPHEEVMAWAESLLSGHIAARPVPSSSQKPVEIKLAS